MLVQRNFINVFKIFILNQISILKQGWVIDVFVSVETTSAQLSFQLKINVDSMLTCFFYYSLCLLQRML